MHKDYIMGIDPGKFGGWALIRADNYGDLLFGKMPLVANQIDVSFLAKILKATDLSKTIVVIEKVSAMPKQGVSSTFTFGAGFGQLIGMCQTLGVSYDLVSPQSWKKTVLKDTQKDKNAAIRVARSLYPDANLIPEGCRIPHTGIADAICIMQMGVYKHGKS